MTKKNDTQSIRQRDFKRTAWRVLSVLAVILWGRLIFGFSAQNSDESSSLSGRVSYAIVEEVTQIRQETLTETQKQSLASMIEHPVRKAAHMSEYAVFAMLLYNMFSAFGVKGRARFLFALLFVFGYALTDEFHQLFVSGRSGQFTDVLIDTAGGLLALGVIAAARSWMARAGRSSAAGTRAFH